MRNRSLELTRQMCRRYPISQIALWRQPGLVAGIALTLLAFPWEQRLLHSLPRNMRRWFVHWFLYQASVMAVIAAGGCSLFFGCLLRRRHKIALVEWFLVGAVRRQFLCSVARETSGVLPTPLEL